MRFYLLASIFSSVSLFHSASAYFDDVPTTEVLPSEWRRRRLDDKAAQETVAPAPSSSIRGPTTETPALEVPAPPPPPTEQKREGVRREKRRAAEVKEEALAANLDKDMATLHEAVNDLDLKKFLKASHEVVRYLRTAIANNKRNQLTQRLGAKENARAAAGEARESAHSLGKEQGAADSMRNLKAVELSKLPTDLESVCCEMCGDDDLDCLLDCKLDCKEERHLKAAAPAYVA